jgi:hypothetical protein
MVGFAILGKAANFRGEEGKKKKTNIEAVEYIYFYVFIFIFLT